MSKNEKVVCLIEPSLAELIRNLSNKKGMSTSSLMRRLLIQELRDQGLLSDDYMANIMAQGA